MDELVEKFKNQLERITLKLGGEKTHATGKKKPSLEKSE